MKQIPGSNWLYFATKDGEVWSTRAGRPLAGSGRARNTYRMVTLCLPSGRKCKAVHTLVAEAFIGPRPKGMEINHKNGNKLDNRPENLEWVTRSQNVQHSYDTGLREGPWKGRKRGPNPEHSARMTGEGNSRAKLNEKQVATIRKKYADGGITQAALAREFCVSSALISSIIIGRSWSHSSTV